MLHTDLMRRGVPWVSMLMSRRELPSDLNLSWRHRVAAASWVGATVALACRRPRAAIVRGGELSVFLRNNATKLAYGTGSSGRFNVCVDVSPPVGNCAP